MKTHMHQITYLPVEQIEAVERHSKNHYDIYDGTKGRIFPDIKSLMDQAGNDECFVSMGKDGWKLVSVVPVLEGRYDFKTTTQGYSFGVPITNCLVLFWEKEIEP
ncbi:MAG: hypothetical protein ABSB95_01010 [Dissulfurispiraceae bacterium]|jgi:hypothetical protein